MDMMPARKMTIVPPVLHRLIITSVGMTVFLSQIQPGGVMPTALSTVLIRPYCWLSSQTQTMQEATAGMMDGR